MCEPCKTLELRKQLKSSNSGVLGFLIYVFFGEDVHSRKGQTSLFDHFQVLVHIWHKQSPFGSAILQASGKNICSLDLRQRIQSSFILENTRDPLKKWLGNSYFKPYSQSGGIIALYSLIGDLTGKEEKSRNKHSSSNFLRIRAILLPMCWL